MVTRKDFKAIAEIVRHAAASTCEYEQAASTPIANELADYFATQNPKFDRQRFLNACGL